MGIGLSDSSRLLCYQRWHYSPPAPPGLNGLARPVYLGGISPASPTMLELQSVQAGSPCVQAAKDSGGLRQLEMRFAVGNVTPQLWRDFVEAASARAPSNLPNALLDDVAGLRSD